MFNRFDQLLKKIRAKYWKFMGMSIGIGSMIEKRLYIRGAKNIKIGNNSYISDSVTLKTSGGKIKFGDNVLIRDGVKIQGGSEDSSYLNVGNHFAINHNSSIAFSGGVEIGDYVMIAPNVTITSSAHKFDKIDTPMRLQSEDLREVIIEDDVWIGANSVILGGVRIKKGTIIGAGSVVTKDTEPFSIMVGTPAKLLKYRE